MILYFVPVNPVVYKDKNNKLIEVTPTDVLDHWTAKRFNGKSKYPIAVYETPAEAIEVARHGVLPTDIAQYPVITLNTDITEEEWKSLKAKHKDNEIYLTDSAAISHYIVPAQRCTPSKASFCYIEKAAQEISLTEAIKNLRNNAAQASTNIIQISQPDKTMLKQFVMTSINRDAIADDQKNDFSNQAKKRKP